MAIESLVPAPGKPKLLDQICSFMRTRRYSLRTEQAYLDWIRRFILFHDKRHPNDMAEKEITTFLSHLATQATCQSRLKTRPSAPCSFCTGNFSIGSSTVWTERFAHLGRGVCRPC